MLLPIIKVIESLLFAIPKAVTQLCSTLIKVFPLALAERIGNSFSLNLTVWVVLVVIIISSTPFDILAAINWSLAFLKLIAFIVLEILEASKSFNNTLLPIPNFVTKIT